MERRVFRLGEALIDMDSRTLSSVRTGHCLLQPKYMEVLHQLAEHQPQVVSRDFLIEQVWDGNVFVGAKALTNAIWHLRRALAQVDPDREWIETLRKGGYRLTVCPEPLEHKPLKPLETRRRLSWLMRASLALALGLGTTLTYLLWHFATTDHHPLTRQLTTLIRTPGRELFPAPSPDGRYLVFYWERYKQAGELYLKDLTQPDLPPRKLTDSPDQDGRAYWGPRGRTLVYARSGRDYCHLMQHRLATNTVTKLADCAVGTAVGLDLSADGRLMAYLGMGEGGRHQIFVLNLEDRSAPRAVPCAGRACELVDRDVAIADDGSKLLISRREAYSKEVIFLHHLDSGEERQLTFAFEDVRGMEWLDDNRALFASQRSGIRSGYLLDIDSGERQSLPIAGLSYPRKVPGQPQVVFHSWDHANYISVLARGELNHNEPYLRSDASHQDPALEPGSGRLAYVSNESGYYEVWLQDADGERRQLTRMESQLRHPAWSNDGHSLAFLGPGEQGNQLYVMTLESGRIRALPSPYRDHFKPSWSLDDQAVIASVLADGQRALAWFPLEGPPSLLTTRPGRYAQMVAPGRIWFSEGNSRYNGRLYELDMTKPEPSPQLLLGPSQFGLPYTWARRDKTLFFMRRGGDYLELHQYDLVTGRSEALIRQSQRAVERSASVVPLADGRILMTQTQQAEVDILRLQDPMLR
ncbi:winged helix-turn-helix domain-containing protein [Ferrimonas balearica]|uniref:winged helix-turn-helix domain-containing protein n=1 Tax=Ferrimonas balearica TaxID=44012 RepID=UPI001C569CE5|nr:winged helix-turn-helix domain-containing protein [Ferrimonas balearica]